MEQRYQALIAVIAVIAMIADGRGVGVVAAQFGVSRQSVHAWLRRYEDHGLEGLANRSDKPKSTPHQMPAHVEAAVLELRREHRAWGPRCLVYELLRRGVAMAMEIVGGFAPQNDMFVRFLAGGNGHHFLFVS